MNRLVEISIEKVIADGQSDVIDEINASERRIKEAVIDANSSLWSNLTNTKKLLSLEVKQ